MSMDLVSVLKWVKSVIELALYFYFVKLIIRILPSWYNQATKMDSMTWTKKIKYFFLPIKAISAYLHQVKIWSWDGSWTSRSIWLLILASHKVQQFEADCYDLFSVVDIIANHTYYYPCKRCKQSQPWCINEQSIYCLWSLFIGSNHGALL